MNHTEHFAKTPSPEAGLFATLGALLRVRGTGASSLDHSGASFYPVTQATTPAHRITQSRKQLSLKSLTLTTLLATFLALPAAAQAEAACPNEQIRTEAGTTGLPDCRAYELVTPPFKDGQPPSVSQTAISADAKITFHDLGAFGEGGNDTTTEGGEYVASRGVSGWSAVVVTPSAHQFQGEGAFGREETESPDFSEGLTETLIGQALVGAKPVDLHLYRRSVSNGSLSQIGPLAPQAAVAAWTLGAGEQQEHPELFYAGASADLSHVLVAATFKAREAIKWLWPGDKTTSGEEAHSLYEYVGGGNSEPELVGVRNQTSLAAAAMLQHKSHINEAAELISECGVLLGAGIDTYNAISRSGEVVYFTPKQGPCSNESEVGAGPAVREVYARLDGERTVDVSEPSTGPAGECEACNESEPRDAVFQGASRDGSSVFFISEQRLFAGANGEAGTNLYEFNQAGPAHHKLTFIAPQLSEAADPGFASVPGGVMRVTELGNLVYFVSKDATLAAASLNSNGQSAHPGEPNLYVRDTQSGVTTFVGTLSLQDESDWSAHDHRPVEATQDGRFVLFASVAHLTADGGGVGRQLYRYEAPSAAHPVGELVRVSVGASGAYLCAQTHRVEPGFNCDGNAGAPPSSVFSAEYTQQGFFETSPARPSGVSISSDGSKVFFQSPEGLTPGALNEACARERFGNCGVAAENVYEWENGRVYLLSDGRDTSVMFGRSTTRLLGADPSGENVFITTASALVPQDSDSQVDIYDVHLDGGFAAETPPVVCSSACRQGGAQPNFPTPASAMLTGSGNPPVVPSVSTPKPKPLTSAQKLANAMKACRRKHDKKKRTACVRHARKEFGQSRKAKK